MPTTPLKIKLGKLIKSGLQAAGLRQLDLARHLNISTSAVSQMLNGKTAPDAAHLEKVFSLLNCSRNQIFIMRDLLAKIRSGVHELRSPLNDLLREARKARNLTYAGLSSLTSISTAELRAFESCSTALPSKEQMEKLSEALEIQGSVFQEEISRYMNVVQDNAPCEVQEQQAGFTTVTKDVKSIPVVSGKSMLEFNPAFEDIKNFVWRQYEQIISNPALSTDDEEVFAINDAGSRFDPALPGSALLHVTLKKYPENDDIVVVKLKNNDKLLLRTLQRQDNENVFSSFLEKGSSEKTTIEDPRDIEWIRRILKVEIKDL
ncbi:MAG: helix-turn-helix domain-containing protein [Lentisphaerae bacterium]|nr:helix-turn-helix domain-containing protein [Lentisphaerota bacterium]MCP4103122.1 helix-turn-helix domain-containing protein [Lentisphaerota bacterium]